MIRKQGGNWKIWLILAVFGWLMFGLAASPALVYAQEVEEVTYTVKEGDTLSEIAISFDTTVAVLMEANDEIIDPNFIYVDQEIVIPAADRPPRTALISPTNGPAGSTVLLQAYGFEPYSQLELLVGPENSEAEVTHHVLTNANGKLNREITIPGYAEPKDHWLVAIRPQHQPGQYLEQSNTFLVTGDGQPDFIQQTILYMIDLEDNGKNGQKIGCNDSLVPVLIDVEANEPLRATLRELLRQEDRLYRQTGLYNALYRSDLHLDRIDVYAGTAYVYLSGTKQLGGTCDEPRFRAQLLETIDQFAHIDQVKIFINEMLAFSSIDQTGGRDDMLVYTVQEGDTLSYIALSFETSINAMMRVNPDIETPNRIITGQRLAIPSTDDDAAHVVVSPSHGETGELITAKADNLQPNADYAVGIGRVDSEFDVVDEGTTTNAGVLEFDLKIPSYAEPNEYWVVVLVSEATSRKIVSNLILIQ